ncbi:MAG: conjugal transfer protein TrbF [Alphaproteobacteria bacterium]|nr:conjugal transfer protein TrbF [Alphaproteobacteria bacterium]MBV9693539.1 conjugal transfer protein TrbF [Alphaproteobacteria bacterium]
MVFRRALQRYGQPVEPETPYQRAGQIWDERIGSARAQAKNWRLVSFGTLGLALLLGGGMLWQASQSRVTPYVVQVDKFGAVQAVGPAIQNYSPTDAEIAWYLSRFVTDVRSLSLDPVVVRRSWLEAYDYATDHGALFLNQYAQANDPFKAVGERTVSVQITSVVRVSDNSFQVKWTEQTFEHDALARTEHWTAILSVVTKQPTTAEILNKNPLGLYVNGVNWSRELDS